MIRFDGKNEVEKEHLNYAIAPLNDCIDYFKGAIFQGQRLINAINSKTDHSLNIIKLEEEFFIFVLDRAIFWLKELGKSYIEFNTFINGIDKDWLKSIKNVRDMRIHFDSYKKGKGREQTKFFVPLEDIPKNAPTFLKRKLFIDATSSIMVGKWYFIGGRIDFYKTMKLLNELSPVIEEMCNSKRLELLKNNHIK